MRFRRVGKVMGWDGPNRAGKSLAAVMALLELASGWPVESWPGLPWDLRHERMGPPVAIGCITISREKSVDGQQRQLAERLPRSLLACNPWKPRTGFGGRPLVLRNGSIFHFLSDLQREQSLENFQWSAAWIDEAVDEWVYERVIARLVDAGGKLVITAVAEKAWIHRVLRMRLVRPESLDPVGDDLIDTITDSTMADNELLEPRQIEQAVELWGGIGSREARMRVLGQYVYLEGVVFPEFDLVAHREEAAPPRPDWTIYELLDPGYRNPFAVAFVGVDASGRRHVFDEIYQRGLTVPQVAALIHAKRREHHYLAPRRAVIDPAADAASHWGQSQASIRQQLAECGIQTLPGKAGPGSVDSGNQRLRALLARDLLRIGGHCQWMLFEFLNYRHKDPDKATGEFLGDKERVVDAHNHLIAALRYGESLGLEHVPIGAVEPPRGTVAHDLWEMEQRAREKPKVWR